MPAAEEAGVFIIPVVSHRTRCGWYTCTMSCYVIHELMCGRNVYFSPSQPVRFVTESV